MDAQKREHDDKSSEQNKRKKLGTPDEADGVTKITDVNDDCLELIFGHLMLQDLVNVADTCKRFQPSAKAVFASKCRGKWLMLHPSVHRLEPFESLENFVKVFGMSNCLKLLRHFGHKITKIDIDYFFINTVKQAVLGRYMNEYCADSLIDITIGASEEVIANWTKPFINAETVWLWSSDLGDLSEWFPKTRRLVLHAGVQWVQNTFPHLEELEIHNGSNKRNRASVAEMLRLNPHLQQLRLLGLGYDMTFMESVSAYLQSLTLLDIRYGSGFLNLDGSSINLKSVKEFNIDLRRVGEMRKIPFSFGQLDKMQLKVNDFKMNDDFGKFLKHNPSLSKLVIHSQVYADTQNSRLVGQIKMDIAKVSPSLDVDVEISTIFRMMVISLSSDDSEEEE
ncbi:uncharacterized protein LOC129569808 [Sitodiplosis mosellana]|uniref:uncharacterized protein LOC129569808 n=1 Tax=Sitodiplosis mosellana TaxID=263140 RepID=UPI00244447C6|nr:uncharacterized protein LOC129569808 [Sitodiplosis mosellana]